MKTTPINQKADEATEFETLRMSIDESSIESLMGNLTNLYSDPVLAVFREYTSNALDSHIKAGQSAPIEVTLPVSTSSNPVLVVRDYGVGMSKEDIEKVYSRYGLSTKTATNTQIGAFGLGAKSALAITDRFDVVTIKDAKRVEFFIKKNNKGVGVIHFVSETETTEPNGVTVTIPVSTTERVSAIHKIAENFFDTWKPNTVKVDGVIVGGRIYDEDKFVSITSAGEPLAWVQRGVGAKQPYSSKRSTNISGINFVVGGIHYTLPSVTNEHKNLIGWGSDLDTALRQMLSSEVEVYVNLPIGSVELTPSREALMLTDRTANTVANVLNDFITQTPSQFASFMNTLDRKNAYQFYARNWNFFGKTPTKLSGFYNRSDVVDEFYGVDYKGEPVPTFVATAKPVGFIESVEGRALGDAGYVSKINLYRAGANRSLTETYQTAFANHIIVKTATPTKETLEQVRKNLRDYAQATFEDKNIVAYHAENSFTNVWSDEVVSVVDYDDFISVAREFRKAKKSVAQVGVVRSKVTYVTFEVNGSAKTATKESVDAIVDNNLVLVDNAKQDFGWWLTTKADGVHKGSNYGVEFDDDELLTLKSVFSGKTLVFLTGGKSADAFMKKFPKAQTFENFIDETVAKVAGQSSDDETVLGALIATHHFGGGLRSVFENIVSKGEETKIANPLTRRIVTEVANPNSYFDALAGVAKNRNKIGQPAIITNNIDYKVKQNNFTARYDLINESRSWGGYSKSNNLEQVILFINASDVFYNV